MIFTKHLTMVDDDSDMHNIGEVLFSLCANLHSLPVPTMNSLFLFLTVTPFARKSLSKRTFRGVDRPVKVSGTVAELGKLSRQGRAGRCCFLSMPQSRRRFFLLKPTKNRKPSFKEAALKAGFEAGPRHIRHRNVVGKLINFRGLVYAPVNENGVIFLFGKVAADLNMYVETIRPGYPDCLAKRYIGKGKWEEVRIQYSHKRLSRWEAMYFRFGSLLKEMTQVFRVGYSSFMSELSSLA